MDNTELQNQIEVLRSQVENLESSSYRKSGSGPLSTRSIADRFVARKAGVSGAGTATTDIRFWAGALFPNRTTAPFRVDDAGNFVASSATISGTIRNGGDGYGDGSDSSVTFDGTSTILGLVPSASVYTLTRDLQTVNLTVNSGVTIITAGYVIYCRDTFTNNGTVHNNTATAGGAGGNTVGVGGTAGVGATGGTIAAGTNGATGGIARGANDNGVNGSTGIAKTGVGVAGVVGGTGGAGGVGVGSNGGPAGVLTAENLSIAFPVHATNSGTVTGSTNGSTELALSTLKDYLTGSSGGTSFGIDSGSGGGGSGGADGDGPSGGGGGSGGSGGSVVVICLNFVNTGAMQAKGAAGGAGGAAGGTNNGGGGGGGGGSGGIMVFVYATYSNTGTYSVVGGAAGAAGAKTGTGTAGGAGGAGTTGLIFRVKNS